MSKFKFRESVYGTEDLDTLMARYLDSMDFDSEEDISEPIKFIEEEAAL